MVNFWSAVFVLPKAFYAKVDSLYAAFLWRNGTSSAKGARVAWSDICKPKQEGGLGIRRLKDFETVFRLKRIWNFLTVSGSLWVAWMKNNIFQCNGFWITPDSPRFSATIRSILQLRPILSNYLQWVIGDGVTASFWYDSWTLLGPLIEISGETGSRSMRLRQSASVCDATRDGSWRHPPARSPAIQQIQTAITVVDPLSPAKGPDIFQWRKANGSFGSVFSSKDTWENLRAPAPMVSWHKVIWFKERIPRNSFMAWLALLRCLPTKDRLLRWGMNVTGDCVLCSSAMETHHHLFFECSYSSVIWNAFASQIWANPPTELHSVAAWIQSPKHSSNYNATTLVKFLFQSIIYVIWKERNVRVFTSVASPTSVLHLSLDRLLRDRMLSLPTRLTAQPSLLQFYFSTYRPP